MWETLIFIRELVIVLFYMSNKTLNKFSKHLKMLAGLCFQSWTVRGNGREAKGRNGGQRIGGRVEGRRVEGRSVEGRSVG